MMIDFYEYQIGRSLLHQSNVIIDDGWNDECTWLKDTRGYPLEPDDVNTLAELDTNPRDDNDYNLHGYPRDK